MNRRKDGNIARERAIVATRGTILDDVERADGLGEVTISPSAAMLADGLER